MTILRRHLVEWQKDNLYIGKGKHEIKYFFQKLYLVQRMMRQIIAAGRRVGR
jgi:hypothetical protein